MTFCWKLNYKWIIPYETLHGFKLLNENELYIYLHKLNIYRAVN